MKSAPLWRPQYSNILSSSLSGRHRKYLGILIPYSTRRVSRYPISYPIGYPCSMLPSYGSPIHGITYICATNWNVFQHQNSVKSSLQVAHIITSMVSTMMSRSCHWVYCLRCLWLPRSSSPQFPPVPGPPTAFLQSSHDPCCPTSQTPPGVCHLKKKPTASQQSMVWLKSYRQNEF